MGKVKDEIDKMLEKSLLIPAAQNYPESSIKIQYSVSSNKHPQHLLHQKHASRRRHHP
jgi:hypothetical protein